MPEYLVRFAQVHESFRKAEITALAEVAGIPFEIVEYNDDVGEYLRTSSVVEIFSSKLPSMFALTRFFTISLHLS